MSARVACCTVCGPEPEPLVMTLKWPRKEFVCLGCGRLFEFFGPRDFPETPELLERMEARKAEFAEHAGAILGDHHWRDGCDKCKVGGEYHAAHATDEEKQASADGLKWLLERTGRAVAT